MPDQEGYIKFNCIRQDKEFDFPEDKFKKITIWRNRLYNSHLIGSYPDGIGFGNISIRMSLNNFIITGSATGNKPELNRDDFVLVTHYNLIKNEVRCSGRIPASSESMSHAAVYDSISGINAVIHVHHLKLWKKLKERVPVTRPDVQYGTTEMALEIKDLFSRTNVSQLKIFVMGGHREGIVTFGDSLDDAGDILYRHFRQIQ